MQLKTKNFVFGIFILLFCLNILAWLAVYELNRPKLLEVNFFDVGQGDAIFIETPRLHQILIDGGPSTKVLEKLGKNMPFWDRTIDLVILTHPDPDHLNGLVEVLRNYEIGMVAFNGAKGTNPAFAEFENEISRKQIPTAILFKGKRILVENKIYLEILAPLESFEGEEVKDFNSSSIVAKLIYGQNGFLFTGDTTRSIEKELAESNINLASDVLKVAHHGSRTSSSEIFLEKVFPQIAVISVGKDNSYGHPHQEVLDVLKKYAKILRTDLEGDIKILCDSQSLKLK